MQSVVCCCVSAVYRRTHACVHKDIVESSASYCLQTVAFVLLDFVLILKSRLILNIVGNCLVYCISVYVQYESVRLGMQE